jgi:hypothetical protein
MSKEDLKNKNEDADAVWEGMPSLIPVCARHKKKYFPTAAKVKLTSEANCYFCQTGYKPRSEQDASKK